MTEILITVRLKVMVTIQALVLYYYMQRVCAAPVGAAVKKSSQQRAKAPKSETHMKRSRLHATLNP